MGGRCSLPPTVLPPIIYMRGSMLTGIQRSLPLVAIVASLALLLSACGGNASTEPAPVYRGFEKYEGRWDLNDVEEYEDAFGGLCDFVLDTRDLTHPELIDRWGTRWITINDLWAVAGYGVMDPSHGDEDAVRDYIALQVDDAVIHQCPGQLKDWEKPPKVDRLTLDDPLFIPVRPFEGRY